MVYIIACEVSTNMSATKLFMIENVHQTIFKLLPKLLKNNMITRIICTIYKKRVAPDNR